MKIRLEKPIDPLGEAPTKNKTEYSCWQPVQQSCLLPVDWAGQRPTVGFLTVGKAVDRTVTEVPKQSVNSLSVDRAGRPEQTETTTLSSGRPGRSTDVHTCTLVHVGRPPGRPTEQFCSTSGRPCGLPDKAKMQVLKIFLKSIYFQ